MVFAAGADARMTLRQEISAFVRSLNDDSLADPGFQNYVRFEEHTDRFQCTSLCSTEVGV